MFGITFTRPTAGPSHHDRELKPELALLDLSIYTAPPAASVERSAVIIVCTYSTPRLVTDAAFGAPAGMGVDPTPVHRH